MPKEDRKDERIQWRQSGSLPIWIATSAALWLLASIYSLIALVPVNNRIKSWKTVTTPPDWKTYRRRWDMHHRWGVVLLTTAFACLPTLILQALDDPFIRMTPETRDKFLANSRVRLVETRHGGHCAFSSPEPGDAGFWAERTLLEFLLVTVEG
jgi:pimeloyl-ACP methyl ester carboxylesterase